MRADDRGVKFDAALFIGRCGPRAAVIHLIEREGASSVVALCGKITDRPLFPTEERYLGVCRACERKANRRTQQETNP